MVAEREVVLILVGGIVVGAFHELLTVPDDGRLDDSSVNCLPERSVADHVLENVSLLVLRGCREVELRDEPAAPLPRGFLEKRKCLIPGRVWVPDVVRLVV